MHPYVGWTLFALIILVVMTIDLGVLNRRAHVPRIREALAWSVAWVSLAMIFAVWVFRAKGSTLGLQFLTGYIVELSLSVDNVFLFAVIFRHFGVEMRFQHRVLFWGIVGALVMRGIMIVAGTALLARFHWISIVFGLFLIATGIRMFLHRNREVDVADMAVLKFLRRHLRLTERYHEERFFVRLNGVVYATPLLLVLTVIELTDLVFAVDSIPAVLAISRDPFIVFTSNVFAILGLRSFYFLLSRVMEAFKYLTIGLSAVLVYVGFKMLGIVTIPTHVSLLIIVVLIGASVAASLVRRKRVPAEETPAVQG